jgi:hypothetical protein
MVELASASIFYGIKAKRSLRPCSRSFKNIKKKSPAAGTKMLSIIFFIFAPNPQSLSSSSYVNWSIISSISNASPLILLKDASGLIGIVEPLGPLHGQLI